MKTLYVKADEVVVREYALKINVPDKIDDEPSDYLGDVSWGSLILDLDGPHGDVHVTECRDFQAGDQVDDEITLSADEVTEYM